MKRFVVAVIATGLVALATLVDSTAGVASSPVECPVCDCTSEVSYLNRNSPVAIPVPEEYDHDDFPADDGYAGVEWSRPYSGGERYAYSGAYEPYNEYAAVESYPADLDMGYGDYGL